MLVDIWKNGLFPVSLRNHADKMKHSANNRGPMINGPLWDV